jgi:Tol biopolymer transport system component
MTGRVIANGPNITAAPPTTEAATLRWVADRVLYSNWAWTPGEQPRQVLMDSQDTTGSPDGRTLIFTRSNGLWRADREGGRVTQIISGEAFYPIVTADNRSVIYLSARSGEQSPWMVPIDGGEPRQLTTTFAAAPGVDISPDGRWLVFPSRDAARKQATVMMCELQDCRPKTVLSGQGVTRLRWMPDGRTLAYVDNDARTNLWLMPTAGGPARQLTRFDNRQIIDFDVSSDGTRLVVARRLETNDIVVLKGLRRQ